MPGHIGTDIVANSRRYFGRPEPDAMTDDDLNEMRSVIPALAEAAPDQIRDMIKMMEEGFRAAAPLSAAGAATVILDAVKAGKWRILVGEDAVKLDEAVRARPEEAYDHQGVGIAPLGGR